jgi:hypothetical protein
MEHEVTDRVENDVLCEHFGYPHGLPLGFITAGAAIASVVFITSPDGSFEGLSEVAHESGGLLHDLVLVLIHAVFLAGFSTVFLFLNSFLKFLIENFLKDTLPNVFFLPDAVVVDKVGQVLLFEPQFLRDFVAPRIRFKVTFFNLRLIKYLLRRVKNCIDHLEIHVFFMNNCRQ